ncbi:MAG: hypothetical protein GTO16_09825 [Candidatus Aminicenantes bacterium]|nr:hypothetical protein [Candidatus Aminicenantes bacterium]
MRRLTAIIALAAVLFLTTSAFAVDPPTPGEMENPGLWKAGFAVPWEAWGNYIVWILLWIGHFPWQNK